MFDWSGLPQEYIRDPHLKANIYAKNFLNFNIDWTEKYSARLAIVFTLLFVRCNCEWTMTGS
jgi:hypothetical protein